MLRTLCAHPKPIVGFRSSERELADPSSEDQFEFFYNMRIL